MYEYASSDFDTLRLLRAGTGKLCHAVGGEEVRGAHSFHATYSKRPVFAGYGKTRGPGTWIVPGPSSCSGAVYHVVAAACGALRAGARLIAAHAQGKVKRTTCPDGMFGGPFLGKIPKFDT